MWKGSSVKSTANDNNEGYVTSSTTPSLAPLKKDLPLAATPDTGTLKAISDTCGCANTTTSSPAVVYNEDNKVEELQRRLKCAELNNSILRGNIDTLKAVVNQLAAQLDMANNSLALHEEKEKVHALCHCGRDGKDTESIDDEASLTTADYERRIALLYNTMLEKDATITALQYEMESQKAEASALLRKSLEKKDNEIIRLMDEMDQLRRLHNMERYARVRRK
ncbi:hypothetical protein MOQ_007199 [Trypanosoma cruzi marinkellei]|uniref:Uncharacterized protein n=1 Tax=Trypanosoma cruzi marinkellei TaxID=85056 RepID=K2M274_TRYCR|nr:hypothetical protein MOQ_007199 [Trypanosoma cruzi marinkellei]